MRPPTHAVVLAAGRGSRLGTLGDQNPKWLLRVGDRTLADRQLDGMHRAGDSVVSTRVVVGHAAEAIEAELARRRADVRVVANPEFARLNNWWSLLRALRELPDDGPVAVLNADLLADPDTIAAFLRETVDGDAEAVLAVDRGKLLTDESMKVAVTPAGTLAAIGKTDIEDPVGEYVGMLFARGSALRDLRRRLEGFVGRPEAADEWYEGAIGRAARAGIGWRLWTMPTGRWVEIDDDDDLRLAEALVEA